MQNEGFENLKVWQKSKEICLVVYRIMASQKDFGFKDQIQRASVSIMNNIAEGYEKRSNKDFIRYLLISKGSCAEVRSMIILGKDLSYVKETEYVNLYKMTTEISKMVSGLISYYSKLITHNS
jgi:four helix bundle protein